MPDESPPKPPTHPWDVAKRIIFGWLAVVIWLALFSGGILIDSMPFREKLGWNPEEALEKELRIRNIEDKVKRLEGGIGNEQVGWDWDKPQETTTDGSNSEASGASSDPVEDDATPGIPQKRDIPKFLAFIGASLTYIPANLALLCIVAAFLGGCSVSDQVITDLSTESKAAQGRPQESALRRRVNYLTEHPAFSAFRGLVVYLLLLSGFFVFAGSETLSADSEQVDGLGKYMRLAGIVSIIGYLAGHDPTIFNALLRFGSGRLNGDGRGSRDNAEEKPNPGQSKNV